MAHRFSNFTAAYNYLETRWSIARNFQQQAFDFAESGQWEWAIKCTLSAFDTLLENFNWSFDQAVYPECLYWAAQSGGEAGVTMDAILSAMITAQFAEFQKFIGIVDAYRVGLWNAPFNADFYAALARGFQKWP